MDSFSPQHMNNFSPQYIPLSASVLRAHSNHLYIYLTVMRWQTIFHNHWFDRCGAVAFFRLNENYARSREASGLHRNNFNPVAKTIPLEQRFQDEFIALMPVEVWDSFCAFLANQPARGRNSWVKLFGYIYYQVACHAQGYFSSLEDICAATGVDHTDASRKLAQLEKCGFITRGRYNSFVALSRTYGIPSKYRVFNLTGSENLPR